MQAIKEGNCMTYQTARLSVHAWRMAGWCAANKKRAATLAGN
jgi:hypothetical protein